MIVTDIISKRYISGNDMSIFNKETHSEFTANSENAANAKSILIMVIPADGRHYEGHEYENPIDLTGKYSFDMVPNGNDRPHYATADWYRLYYQLNNDRTMQDQDYFSYNTRLNTITFAGHYFTWNSSAGSYSIPHQGTGHWGSNVYEGVGQVRNGVMKSMRECNYNSIGGGPMPLQPLGY